MASHGHKDLKPWDHLHHQAGGHDGGKCLGRHNGYYNRNNSCAYRWQAEHRARGEDRAIYDSHNNPQRRIDGEGWRSVPSYRVNKYAEATIETGTPFTAQSGKSAGKELTPIKSTSFRTAFAPYANNAHHLLPDAELRGAVFDVTAMAPEVADVIFQDLLHQNYNLNHWRNMMILPGSEQDGCAIGLPTHPAGHNHLTYSAKVRSAVVDTLSPYEDVVEQVLSEEDHDPVDAQEVKDDVESISDDLHDELTSAPSRQTIHNRCASNQDIRLDQLHAAVARKLGV